MKVLLVPTGTANLASVRAALERAGAEPVLAQDAAEIVDYDRVLLPGVGAFGAGMSGLRSRGWEAPLAARIRAGRPTLTICLGLQLCCEASAESPGVPGLGVVPGVVTRFPDTVRVPQLGWNHVEPEAGCELLQPGHAAYANSYRLDRAPGEGWLAATSDHGGPFVAALERGAVLLCQFHPELSGAWGAGLLARWLERAC